MGRLEKLDSKSRVVILLSDGEETVGEIMPDAAAKLAKDAKVRVYTIGAGRGVRGPLGMVHKPDFSSLRNIARKTDGTPAITCTFSSVKPGAADTAFTISVAPSGMRAIRSRASFISRPVTA